MDAQPSIVLLDDEPVTRAWLRRLLEDAAFDVRAEAGDAQTAIEVSIRERPELCLVDLSVSSERLRVVRELSQRVPAATVVVLSGSEDRGDMIDAIWAGASGFLCKSMNPDRIAPALRGTLSNEAAIPRFLVTELVRELQTLGRHRAIAGRNGRTELTPREWEILELMCAGLSGPTIAARLTLSPVTVRRHRAEAVRKLGVRDHQEAVALMRESP